MGMSAGEKVWSGRVSKAWRTDRASDSRKVAPDEELTLETELLQTARYSFNQVRDGIELSNGRLHEVSCYSAPRSMNLVHPKLASLLERRIARSTCPTHLLNIR